MELSVSSVSGSTAVWFDVRTTRPETLPPPGAYVGPGQTPALKLHGKHMLLYLYDQLAPGKPAAKPFQVLPVVDTDTVAVWSMLAPSAVLLNKRDIMPRCNQADMTDAQRQAYKDAIVAMNRVHAPAVFSNYGALVAIHGQMIHDMHGFMGRWGVQRFLAWHRVYLAKFQKAAGLQHTPLPYWDWTTARDIPTWLNGFLPVVQLPDGTKIEVVRNSGVPAALPTAGIIGEVLNNTAFTAFTSVVPVVPDGGGLEGIHNGVHDWFVDSTMNDLSNAPADPIFWMHHANIDRLWAMWQWDHPDEHPALAAGDVDDKQQPANVFDPWPEQETDTRATLQLGYTYDT